MTDYLKVAKDCGARITSSKMIGTLEEGLTAIADGAHFTSEQLEAYTSRILASQQAAHDAEIAELKESWNDLRGFLERTQKELSTANDRIEHLEGPAALQADALNAVIENTILDSDGTLITIVSEAISASAETVAKYKEECEQSGAVKALEPIIRLCQDSIAEPNEGMSDYSDGYDTACKDILELLRATSKKAGT